MPYRILNRRKGFFARATLALLAIFAASFLWAARPAHAQVYPCNGPGPGEVMVGTSGGGNGVAPTPLCRSVDSGPPPAPLPDMWMSVVGHPDTTELWITRIFATAQGAESTAFDACTQAMGEGCLVAAGTWRNESVIVVYADPADNLYAQGGIYIDDTAKAARKSCEASADHCRKLATVLNIGHMGDMQFPQTPVQRRLFGAAARVNDKAVEKWSNTVWMVTGQSGYKAAQNAVLAKCQADSGMACGLRITVGNGLVARAIDDRGQIYWLDIADPKFVKEQLRNLCGKGRTCRLIDTYDARIPRSWVMKGDESDAPVRGFYATARPSDPAAEKAWGRQAVVTGARSVADAQAAAIALCESDSKATCQSGTKYPDDGAFQFLVLSRTRSGEPRTLPVLSEDTAGEEMVARCAKDNEECGKGTTIDLAKPMSKTVKL